MAEKDFGFSPGGTEDDLILTSTDSSPGIVLTVETGGKCDQINANNGDSLLDVLRQGKLYVNSPCGGQGTCGKCRIIILKGKLELRESGNKPARFANEGDAALACLCRLVENCSIDIGKLGEQNFLGNSDFDLPAAIFINTGLETVRFAASSGIWNDGRSIADIVSTGVSRQLNFSPRSLRQLSAWFGNSLRQDHAGPESDLSIWLTLQRDRVILVRTSVSAPVYGLGVDIGTTTVAFSLVDMEKGTVCKNLSVLNSQRQYGADVISRIQKGTDGGTDALRDCIRDDILRGIAELCGDRQDSLVRVVIAGNTTMLHFLLGLQGASLALFPFNPVTMALMDVPATALFGLNSLDCNATLLPSVGAYMGADIIAGLLYCRMDQAAGVSLFIDVGTNGEMAIGCSTRLICVSTAAGPAFEGANISWGTGSVPGAISAFDLHDGQVEFLTIGDAPPIGICGSAVVDIVAACLRSGLIDRTGRFVSEEMGKEGLPIAQNQAGEWIRFSQKDIREFQLAKSAIRSGLEILMREYGCRWNDVEKVYLAGGFGTRINPENAVEVGLFPFELLNKIQSVGNSSLGGTVHYLLYEERQLALEHLTKAAKVLDLSRHPSFNDLFMEQLQF